MTLEDFTDFVRQECAQRAVTLVISPASRVYYQAALACNGFFESRYPLANGTHAILSGDFPTFTPDSDMLHSPVLAAARGGKSEEEFLGLLVHEYCHMRQFTEGSDLWMDSREFDIWEQWLAGKEFEPSVVGRVWHRIVRLEADCETRALALAERLGLPLDRAAYARRANAYLFFYTWALQNRRFYETAPYEIPAIVAEMPERLLAPSEYVGERARGLVHLFDGCAAARA